MSSNGEASTSSRPEDPARLSPEKAERLGRLTIARLLFGMAVLSSVGVGLAGLSLVQCVRTMDRMGPKPTCAQCQLADPRTAIVRGGDTVATIVELATLPPERAGEDSLRLYRARLRRGHSIGGHVVAIGGRGGPLELIPRDSAAGSAIVGRLFVDGVDHPIAVLEP